MKPFLLPKQYIFTIVFGLLVQIAFAGKPETHYYSGVWDGLMLQINNPQAVGKKKFCIKTVTINGKKIKTNYKSGGIEVNPEDYGFKAGDEMLIEIISQSDCDPTFHSKGFIPQRD